jgi:predicted MPP superfamily phosphohydrolase
VQHTTLAVTATAVLIGAAAAWVALRVARRESWTRVGLGVLAAAAVTVVLSWVSLIALVPRGLDHFGAVHLGYLLATLSIPMVGGALLVWGLRRGVAIAPVVVGGILLLPAPVGAYATHVEPRWLRTDVHELTVDESRAGTDSLRVGVLADVQTDDVGAYENEAVDRLLALEPDVILVPGDLFQGSRDDLERETADLRALLTRLEAPGGAYIVQGDSDGWFLLPEVLRGTGVVPLYNQTVRATVGDRQLLIGGTELRYDSRGARQVVDALETTAEDGTIRLLLAHRPDVVDELRSDSRVDLVVAGHTHGGQIVVPLLGPPVTMSDVPRTVARGGLHELDGNSIVVSPGVGMERGQAPQVRFLSRPAIVLVDLR